MEDYVVGYYIVGNHIVGDYAVGYYIERPNNRGLLPKVAIW